MSEEHTSQALSQRLLDKGFRAEHTHYYVIMNDGGLNPTAAMPWVEAQNYSDCKWLYAYTFTELWGVVPERWFKKSGDMYYWQMKTDQHQRCCIEVRHSQGALKEVFKSKSPAEALGLLVEWLIDNGYVKDLIGKGE